MPQGYDVIIIGAGAAGLMCAAEAGKRGRRVWLIDHAKKTGEKIRISGGGRSNFTNIHTKPANFLSQNPHFCKSALSRYTPQNFIALVNKHGIKWHEKKLGQLFCDDSSQQNIDMLLKECSDAGVTLDMDTAVEKIEKTANGYAVYTSRGTQDCAALVIATGGLSIPKIGATDFGYHIARQFGLNIVPTRAGLVPLTFQADLLARCKALSGVSVDAQVRYEKTAFAEGLLFTHRGLSGPSILQISSYWQETQAISVDLAHGVDVLAALKAKKKANPKQEIQNALAEILPKSLAQNICDAYKYTGRLADTPDKILEALAQAVNHWQVKPSGTEGYRTAEVTLGGVDTKNLSSKTMEAMNQPGLYFIGEVADVTGHLGGFNFQWAWSSGYVAGQFV
jgi:predicted Rossmann fold flavoprotein